MVHVDPMRGEESIVEEVRTISRRQGLTVHDISVHDLRGELFINLDLELPEALTLEEGHGVVDSLEGEMAQELGPQAHITVHMEPERAQVPPGQMAVEAAFLRAKVKEVAGEMGQVLGCHKVVVQRVEGELVVTLHCVLEKDLSVGEAHEVSRDLEKRLRAEVPIVDRVLVHLEPPGE
jgi:divalent metal cation (Fe/Co/Zn/Cd) transporter